MSPIPERGGLSLDLVRRGLLLAGFWPLVAAASPARVRFLAAVYLGLRSF
jgi:hypothetical protein